MPPGYFGLIQTKGSLARLFIAVTCNDGQIDAGYEGRVTFEIVNLGHLRVRAPRLAPVAELYVFRTSTNNVSLYNGRYQGADKPTIYKSH
jgi:deoxycytidine triphosphate deaminase